MIDMEITTMLHGFVLVLQFVPYHTINTVFEVSMNINMKHMTVEAKTDLSVTLHDRDTFR